MKLALISMNLSDHFLYGEPGKEGGTPGIHGTLWERGNCGLDSGSGKGIDIRAV